MPDGRRARIALELAFLVAVAAVLAVAAVRPALIVLGMLLAWAIVALLEWAARREQPHWGSGAPPRYHVPYQALPPRPPSNELPPFSSYPAPAPRAPEAPTWIATPELSEELLGWPAVQPVDESEREEPPAEPELEEPGWAAEAVADRWAVEEPPFEPEPVAVEPEPEPEPIAVEPEPEPAPVKPEPVALEPEPLSVLVAVRLARHHLDPFEEPPAGRRWRRRAEAPPPAAELSVLPRHARLPARELEETMAGRSRETR